MAMEINKQENEILVEARFGIGENVYVPHLVKTFSIRASWTLENTVVYRVEDGNGQWAEVKEVEIYAI